MSFDLGQIKHGTVERPPRIFLVGTEKVGKSSFASQFPTPLLIPVKGEEGVDAIDAAKTPVVTTFQELLEIFGVLYEQEHEFETLVIDSVSTLEPLVHDVTVRRTKSRDNKNYDSIESVGGGWHKGYTEALVEWRQITDSLDMLRADRNMASILIGHTMIKPFANPLGESFDSFVPTINKHAAGLLARWADSILFATPKVYVREGSDKRRKGSLVDERKLYTQARPAHPGGGRGVYGHIPYELDLNFASFAAAVKAAKERNLEEVAA